jgi:hypothetical protein
VALGVLVLFAPMLFKQYVNDRGADNKGYTYSVGEVKLNPLKSEIRLENVRAYNKKTSVSFAEVSKMFVSFNWAELLRSENKFKVKIDELDLIISKDLFEELKRIKMANNLGKSEFHIEEVVADIQKTNIRDHKDDHTRTLLSLIGAVATLSNFGPESINEKTKFKVHSKIVEGGELDLKGQTQLEADSTPWTIIGEMTKINSKVIEKLAGDKIPLEITPAEINSKITAQSLDGQIHGVIEQDADDVKLIEEESQVGKIARNVAKATKQLLDETEIGKDKKVGIPFTLNQNFTLDFEASLKELRK